MSQSYLRFSENVDHDSLSHFGVKGMHWGVWNEETRRRHMGGGRKVRSSDIRGGSGRVKTASNRDYNKLMRNAAKAEATKHKDRKGLSDRQKTAIKIAIGAAAVAAVAGVSIAVLRANPQIAAKMKREFDANGAMLKNKELSHAQDLKKVNYGAGIFPGRSSNCPYCSVSYDLRRKGYDVKAGKTLNGAIQHQFLPKYYSKKGGGTLDHGTIVNESFQKYVDANYKKVYGDMFLKYQNTLLIRPGEAPYKASSYDLHEITMKNLKESFNSDKMNEIFPSAKDVEKALLSQGEGARGAIGVSWRFSFASGHSIAYEVRNGKVHFPDGQISREHDLQKLLNRVSRYDGIEFFRLDNAEPNIKALLNDGIIENRVTAEISDAALRKVMGSKL